MPRRYPPEFRRKVLDLLKAGRSVAELVRDLQISDQTIYNWRRQELIDTGQLPGISSGDQAELVAAPAAHRRAGDRAGDSSPGSGVAEGGGAPKRPVRGHQDDGRGRATR